MRAKKKEYKNKQKNKSKIIKAHIENRQVSKSALDAIEINKRIPII